MLQHQVALEVPQSIPKSYKPSTSPKRKSSKLNCTTGPEQERRHGQEHAATSSRCRGAATPKLKTLHLISPKRRSSQLAARTCTPTWTFNLAKPRAPHRTNARTKTWPWICSHNQKLPRSCFNHKPLALHPKPQTQNLNFERSSGLALYAQRDLKTLQNQELLTGPTHERWHDRGVAATPRRCPGAASTPNLLHLKPYKP